jgi:hypothetical protein
MLQHVPVEALEGIADAGSCRCVHYAPWNCLQFALLCLGSKRRFAFWGNTMECYARKLAGACTSSS